MENASSIQLGEVLSQRITAICIDSHWIETDETEKCRCQEVENAQINKKQRNQKQILAAAAAAANSICRLWFQNQLPLIKWMTNN